MLSKSLELISILLLLNLGCGYAMESDNVFIPAPLDSHNGIRLISVRCGMNHYDEETVTLALHRAYTHMVQLKETGINDGLLKIFETGTAPGGDEHHFPLPGPYYSFPIRDLSKWKGPAQVDEVVFTKDGKLVKVVYYLGYPKLQQESSSYTNCAQQLELSRPDMYYTPDTVPYEDLRRKWHLGRLFKGASSDDYSDYER